MTASSAGAEGVAFGPGKLSVALRRDSNDITQTSTATTNNYGRSGTSLDMRLVKIAANPGGELEFGIDLRKSDQKDSAPRPGRDGGHRGGADRSPREQLRGAG